MYNEFRYSYHSTVATKFREKCYGVPLRSAAMPRVAIVGMSASREADQREKDKRPYRASQDGRQAARVFALAVGILFSIVFVLHAITF
jgi:hypothetical protein